MTTSIEPAILKIVAEYDTYLGLVTSIFALFANFEDPQARRQLAGRVCDGAILCPLKNKRSSHLGRTRTPITQLNVSEAAMTAVYLRTG